MKRVMAITCAGATLICAWLTPAGALGRPMDILIKDNGVIFLSDDKAGVV
jgi:hypothetical protein